ncbi:MAG: cytochrome c1 [Gammaproteobacteria bacterium]
MKKLSALLLLILPAALQASSAGVHLQEVDIDLADYASLKRGAKNYVTYCLGCHSIKHIRYIRISEDFGIDRDTVLKEIAPQGASIYDSMNSAMNPHDASKWFGTKPPDLSLVSRSRGAEWLYTYLKGFYLDDSKVLGVNNTVFRDVGMPNVLWQLQGLQKPAYAQVEGKETLDFLTITDKGTMSEVEFDQFVTDLVNFLAYVGEPVQLERERLGKYVLFFILMFLAIAYLLKKEYWKDIH